MKIKKTLEQPDGTIQITGEFTPEEVDIIIEVGLNTLYQQGALPFKAVDKEDLYNYLPNNGTEN